MQNDSDDNVILHMEDISKSFGGIHALSHINFKLNQGEVHALIGENGAGKSTFLNILSAVYHQDSGSIYLHGKQVEMKNPLVARKRGIVMVHQEMQLIPEMTVAQNIFLGYEPLNSYRVVDFKKMKLQSDKLLEELNAEFSSEDIVKTLSTAQMQMVEIAKALRQDFDILALDEPTSSLTAREIEQLFKIVKELKQKGKSIIYISHRFEEIFEIADRATIFRDGQYINTVNVKDVNKDQLISMMVGRKISDEKFNENSSASTEVVLEAHNLSGKKFKDVSFQLRKGEILGISGLVGAGRSELVRAIFGADKLQTGDIRVKGLPVKIRKPKDAIRAGIMMIPEDRKLQGFVGLLSNYSNVSLSSLPKYTKHGVIHFHSLRHSVDELTKGLQVYPPRNTLLTMNLSGGNQQKIVIAKALSINPDILILDEPTRGIDVNAKHEIYILMRKLADMGKSIIMISSELPEILKMSDRVIIMYEGQVTGEVSKDEASEENIMQYAIGGRKNA